MPLADVVDGLVLRRAVCYLLKTRIQPVTILFGPRQTEVFQSVWSDFE